MGELVNYDLTGYVQLTIDLASNSDRLKQNADLIGGYPILDSGFREPKSISIIVCSADDRRFATFKSSIDTVFDRDVQLVRIQDAASMAGGYNRGVALSNGGVLIFCHDDIEFLGSGALEIIREDLKRFDLVGVAGTTRLVEGKWITAGQPFIHGQVVHQDGGPPAGSQPRYQLCTYGLGRDDDVVANVQALDGLFMAVRRQVLDRVRFDETLFDGFHLYDLDFSFGAFLNGLNLAVDHRIRILHRSAGNFNGTWEKYFQRFNAKYLQNLARKEKHPQLVVKGLGFNSRHVLTSLLDEHGSGRRLFIDQTGDGSSDLNAYVPQAGQDDTPWHIARGQKLPVGDSYADYLQVRLQSISGPLIHEIFRVCRQGAIVELRIDAPGLKDSVACSSLNCRVMRSMLEDPQNMRITHGQSETGRLVFMGAADTGRGVRTIYFQTQKRI
jgi:GT2 family glycosyltransferase